MSSTLDKAFDRRRFLQSAAALTAAPLSGAASDAKPCFIINDVSRLNPVNVAGVVRPVSTEQLSATLRAWRGPVSIGGARYSMGGQIAAPDTLHLDMRGLDEVVRYDPSNKVIRVQGGMTWRAMQDVIDPHDQSAKIMQSYSNFSIGGSVSVNCHGRYVGAGPLVNSIRALQLMTVSGDVLELSRTKNAELFKAAVGGYGGLGVITEVELDLALNENIERVSQSITMEEYPEYFRRDVLQNPSVVLHSAHLTPPGFDRPNCVSWIRTTKPLTVTDRLTPRGKSYHLEQSVIVAATELPGGNELRKFAQRMFEKDGVVLRRNYEASMDTASLEPYTRMFSTFLLQEYFIPADNFLSFAKVIADLLRRVEEPVLNVSIRHASADNQTLLNWAPAEVFCFVVYFKQRLTASADARVAQWTRRLIDAALATGGRYFLPYRLHANPQQFKAAYPSWRTFKDLKQAADPQGRLRNLLWDRYLI